MYVLISWGLVKLPSDECFTYSTSVNEKSILIQVMAWYHQSTTHYVIQGRPSSIVPYGLTRANEPIVDLTLEYKLGESYRNIHMF